ncbi:MAG: dTDP-glucose 4,6-dehydratase [Parcubacteria group bacterium]|nr:dTDP-glucose 4,6-dehydratase [Parcubacteria group bacterium]|tara:strand:- start:33207 stop:34160 length:954 start_codon:yes stop_codon:yes gene_type:complete
MNLLVTGGCGFIGSNFIEHVINKNEICKLVNVDCLSYAGSLNNTKKVFNNPKYLLEKYNLSNYGKTYDTFYKHDITHVVHLAAETHVDNSISNADAFLEANILGTHNLLKAALKFKIERFHHVSTDEVYGHLNKDDKKFSESTPYDPRNPYSASKAGSDFLVRSYFHTHNLPVTISNCSNNYGPNQHEEKFIPTVTNSLLNERDIPVYGKGNNIRDWIYVDDHCKALWKILKKGKLGETYLVGANCEKTNLEIIYQICKILGKDPDDYISFVEDRLGHDFRYAINSSKVQKELKWKPCTNLKKGLQKTIKHYEKKLS